LRDHQLKAVNSILEGKDVLVLTATGSGKSICKKHICKFIKILIVLGYQLPALIKGIPVFVVSPLISLMEDQVLALREKGIQACDAKDFQLWLNSSVIYLSPEKLEGEIYNVEAIFKRRGILCFAIDECHCISEWGHDFRNSYRKLSILREKFPSVPIVALTATATPQITQDVISSLKLRNPIAVRSSFNRKNLFYEVKVKSNLNKDLTVEEIGNGSCIVYCLTKNDADSIANHLKKIGILADAYHSACTEMQRKKVHHSFLRDEIQCVVATVAFGMGIDKPVMILMLHFCFLMN
jgi:RecQ family ATP-dependent DNA helicase